MNWISYGLILVGYYALHSVMASSQVKSLFTKIGIGPQIHRMVFNLVALVATYIVYLRYTETKNALEFEGSNWGVILIVTGAALVFKALINYDLLAFIGLTRENPTDELLVSGLNARLRHPLYLGILLGLIGWVILQPTSGVIVTFIITFCYVHVGIYFEEKKLVHQFGQQYVQYKKEVPKLIPKMKKAQE